MAERMMSPKVVWLVIDSTGKPYMFQQKREAQEYAGIWNELWPSSAPHVATKYVLAPTTKKPDTEVRKNPKKQNPKGA